jgi:ferritin-like metal-binding protein YciE
VGTRVCSTRRASGRAARTENYEIAAYEGLRRMAKAMGEDTAVDLLDENLKQEKEMLREVEKITTCLRPCRACLPQ